MGGGGGKASTKQISATPDPALSAFTQEYAAESKPVREEIFRQVEEALTTGGVGARIPIAQRGVEATQSATSQAAQQTQAALASAGLGRSPFGQNVLAQQQLAGQTAAANIFPQIAAQLAQLAPGLATGSAGTIVSGLGQAAGIGTQQAIAGAQIGAQRDIASLQAMTQLISSIMSSAGGAAGAAFI